MKRRVAKRVSADGCRKTDLAWKRIVTGAPTCYHSWLTIAFGSDPDGERVKFIVVPCRCSGFGPQRHRVMLP